MLCKGVKRRTSWLWVIMTTPPPKALIASASAPRESLQVVGQLQL